MPAVLQRSGRDNVTSPPGNSLALFIDSAGNICLKDTNGIIELLSNYITGGGTIDQDNNDVVKMVRTDKYKKTDILGAINGLPQYTVSETESVWFILGTSKLQSGPLIKLKNFTSGRVYKMMIKGKGTYGVGATQLTEENIMYISDQELTAADIAAMPGTQIIPFGAIAPEDVWTHLNTENPTIPIQSQDAGYVLVTTDTASYLFIGTPGTYGAGAMQSTALDFQELEEEQGPYLWDLEAVTTAGSTATIENDVVFNFVADKDFSVIGSSLETMEPYVEFENGEFYAPFAYDETEVSVFYDYLEEQNTETKNLLLNIDGVETLVEYTFDLEGTGGYNAYGLTGTVITLISFATIEYFMPTIRLDTVEGWFQEGLTTMAVFHGNELRHMPFLQIDWNETSGPQSILNKPPLSTGLEALDEGSGIGWRLIGRDPANYGPIGENAVDFSLSTFASTTRGTTGDYSVSFGTNNTVAGSRALAFGSSNVVLTFGSIAFGDSNEIDSDNGGICFAHGLNNTITKGGASAFGDGNEANANRSFTAGWQNITNSLAEFVVGHNSIDLAGNPSSYVVSDSVFRVGIGSSGISRADGFRVYKDGAIWLTPLADPAVVVNLEGKMFYNKTSKKVQFYNGSQWLAFDTTPV